MNRQELEEFWTPSGCSDFKEIEGLGLCAIMKFMFTHAIVTGLDNISYRHRWCFDTKEEALTSFKYWDGTGDPLGLWRRYKGDNGQYQNVRRDDFNPMFNTPSPHLSDDQKT